MPCGVRDFHAGADVDAEAERASERHGLLADHFAAQRVRGEILHRDGVVALDEQEVVDADDVVVRDLARVAQLVHEALHDLFVFRDVRVQELENEPLVDHGVFHEQHGAERALADAFDVLVAAFDDVAGLERLDVELLRAGHLSACLTAFATSCSDMSSVRVGWAGVAAVASDPGAWRRRRRGRRGLRRGVRRRSLRGALRIDAEGGEGVERSADSASTTGGCRSPRSASRGPKARAAPPARRSVRLRGLAPGSARGCARAGVRRRAWPARKWPRAGSPSRRASAWAAPSR